jgi:hypothetical protein
MGLGHSPSIVSSNLVLALDPANTKCYVGSGVTIRDLLGISSAGTLINGPTYSSNFGGYLNYDGTNDYTSIPHSNSINISDNITFSMWCRMNDLTYGYYPLSKMTGLNGYEFGFDAASRKMFVGIRNNAGDGYKSAIAGTTVDKNIWTHYTGTKSGTGVSIFINGVYSGGLALTYIGSLSASTPFTLGSANGSYYTPCDISQVLVYSKKLSDDEIKQNYDATKKRYEYDVPIITDGLILNLDAGSLLSYAGSGNSWVDVSKNNNIGLLVNGPTYTGSGSTAALVFDGTNDYAIIQDNSGLALTSQGSLNVWFKLNSSSNQVIVSKGNVYADRNAYGIYIYNTQGIIGEIAGSATFNQVPTNSSFASTNVWRMATISWDSSLLSFYVNGSLIGKVSQTITPNTSGFPFVVGGNGNTTPSTFSASSISSVLVYNRALRSSEIYQNYDAMRSRYGL